MKKIVFLHIPKTAGQSVHSFFVSTFGAQHVCPARTMEQLSFLSLPFLSRFRVFSGHFDWDAIASVPGEKFTFTVLRDPFERILSFYFYLREIGLRHNGNSGIRGADLAFTLSPDAFFWEFLDKDAEDIVLNYFDNFYTFYFGGRRSDTRSRFSEGKKTFDSPLRFAALNLARENLSSVDLILPFDEVWKVPDEFGKVFPECGKVLTLPHVNANNVISRKERFDKLKDVGASDWIFDVLSEFCRLDDELFKEFCG